MPNESIETPQQQPQTFAGATIGSSSTRDEGAEQDGVGGSTERCYPIGLMTRCDDPKGVRKVFEPTWRELVQKLTKLPPCDGTKDGKAYVPGCSRSLSKVESVSLVVLDIEAKASGVKNDDGVLAVDEHGDVVKRVNDGAALPPPVAEVAERLRIMGWTGMVVPSYSHLSPSIEPKDKDHHRYRIVLQPTRSVLKEELEGVVLQAASYLGLEGCLDDGSKQANRLYFFPRFPSEARRDRGWHPGVVDAEPLDVDVLVHQHRAEKRAAEQKPKSSGTRDNDQTISRYNAKLGLSGLKGLLAQLGYADAKWGKRMIRPGSTTGMAGVVFYKKDGIDKFYSHGDGDVPMWQGQGHDAFDVLAKLHGDDVKAALDAARVVLGMPKFEPRRCPDSQPGEDDAPAGDSDGNGWPDKLDPAALHGIAGEFVRLVEPVTESDPAALLIQFLVAFGALVGRGPHYRVESTNHHASLFTILVGQTSKARKGTSWGRVVGVFEQIRGASPGEGWKPHAAGLSSGEGLKYAVRDERIETKKNKRGEMVTEIVDVGVEDKRLLVTESEFAGVLRAVQRQGNTLSATVREAWDTGNLRTLTKNDPITATGAHVCIIGHITTDELRAELSKTDMANGFANRFLFVASRRSKCLPHGGADLDEREVGALRARLHSLALEARTRNQIRMTPDAMRSWEAVYPMLSEGGEGMYGSVTARAEAQVVRLALVYALLDGANQIDDVHLKAALAFWGYCDETAQHIYGSTLGDRTADEIMRALRVSRDRGMTRTDISGLFKRHQSAEQIGAALELLNRKGRATCEIVDTAGRPSELWRAN
jgi:hypothetical protein